ncbi:MAG TPA: asparagine synthase-related protein [Candidatus Acidoferrum sp.]
MHGDNAPIDRARLHSLTDFLSFRGPDEQNTWMDHSIGMGHALLRTTYESRSEKQPLSQEERYWVVADARLDAREELIAELKHKGQAAKLDSPDCELVLQAYAAWGEACVDHLLGDFSFAIWDKEHKKLFCARDHFGIKPFYYVHIGEMFICSNTLNCVRLHPCFSEELNETAVGDFLLFGLNCDNATTIFRDILRLPPAYTLTVSSRGLQVKRYWTPPTQGRIRYQDQREYFENFCFLFDKAVADRVRTDRLGILLSGGLDSSAVAATAKEVCAKASPTMEIRGYTHVYKSLIPHNDEEYAKETAEFLGFPLRVIPFDGIQIFDGWNEPNLNWPEPISNPLVTGILNSYRIISAECGVVLSGEGGDDLMIFQMWPYVRDLGQRGEWKKLVMELGDYLWIRPFPWRGIRARVLRLLGKDSYLPVFPEWLNPGFSQRSELRKRWKEWWEPPESRTTHPIHPMSYASLFSPQWTLMFEQENAGVTHSPVETRHPFLDVRIVNYLLAIPPFPWFFRKMLVREALVGRLPERVRTRPKTPLQEDPLLAQLRRTGMGQLKPIPWCPGADQYIDRSALVQPHGRMNPEQVSTDLRPYCLNIWLQSARRIRYNIYAEARNG